MESRELDVGIARVDLLIKQHNDTRAEIDTFKPKYQTLLDEGKCYCGGFYFSYTILDMI